MKPKGKRVRLAYTDANGKRRYCTGTYYEDVEVNIDTGKVIRKARIAGDARRR